MRPLHPDRCGGIGFLSLFPGVFRGFVFALSCVLASLVLKDIESGTVPVTMDIIRGVIAAWALLVALLFLAPLLCFYEPLFELRDTTRPHDGVSPVLGGPAAPGSRRRVTDPDTRTARPDCRGADLKGRTTRSPKARLPCIRSGRKWIARDEFGEQREVPVRGEQFVNAMRNTECRDTRVVHDGASHLGTANEGMERREETVGLVQQRDAGRRCPGIDLLPCLLLGTRRVLPDTRVGDHAVELIDARPRDRPGAIAFGQHAQQFMGCAVLMRFAAMRVDEDVGIDCDHLEFGSP